MTRACELALRAANALFFSKERLRSCALDQLAGGAVAVTVSAKDPLSGKLEALAGTIQDALKPGDAAFCPADGTAVVVQETGLPIKAAKFQWEAEYRKWGGTPELRGDLSEHCIVLLVRDAGPLDPTALNQKLQRCAFMRTVLIPAELHLPTSLEVRVGVHRHSMIPDVAPPCAQWMFEDMLIGMVESTHRRSLALTRLKADGHDDTTALDLNVAYELLGVPLANSYGVKGNTQYQLEVVGGPAWNQARLESALRAAPSAARQLMAGFLQRELDEEKARTAKALQARLLALQSRSRICDAAGATIGIVPSNEQETIILAERLSSRIAPHFSGVFRMEEYTPQQGIDAVVHTKLSSAQPAEYVLTEFEFALANFFQHRHHPEQVRLIICWTDGGIAEGEHAYGQALGRGPLKFRISAVGWRRTMQFSDSTAHLVVLNRLPGIEIKP